MKKKKIKIKRMFSSLRRSINRPLESPLAFARSTPISPEEKKASSALFTDSLAISVCGGRTVTWRAAYVRWCTWEVAAVAL
ncbi:hypothetical protein ES288_D01G127000v1 [Gossypium darwinii]|uniref:Uncharacterized protein n=1 Tax=Gossypium darwinii TaxID=34276 RepID=A0A5D2DPA1_GOSDA|nr:hypothetical protein ES288_D01G127000v1 [Gossypium darwinii]